MDHSIEPNKDVRGLLPQLFDEMEQNRVNDRANQVLKENTVGHIYLILFRNV